MMYCSCNFRGKCGEEDYFGGQDIKNFCKRCKKLILKCLLTILPSSHGTLFYDENTDQFYVHVESTYAFIFIFGEKNNEANGIKTRRRLLLTKG